MASRERLALRISERYSDFGPSKGVSLCASGCCTCTCCCLWTATGIGAGFVGLAIGSAVGKKKHGKPGSPIRKGFWTGVVAGFFLYELSGLVAALVADSTKGLPSIGDLLFYWFLWYGAAVLFPMGVGGLVGAYWGRRAVRRSEDGLAQNRGVGSIASAWWAVLSMWVAGGIGVAVTTKLYQVW